MKRLVTLCLAALTQLASASSSRAAEKAEPATQARAQQVVEAFAKQHAKGITINLGQPQKLKISCPIGVVCDSKFYRALKATTTADDLEVFSYVSFSGEVLGNLNTESVKKHFSYLYVIPFLSELKAHGWDARLRTAEDPYRKGNPAVVITGYGEGRLHATLTTRVKDITGYKDHCIPMDAPAPPQCMVGLPVDIPLVLNFDIELEDGVLDCSRPEKHERCG